MAQAPTPSPFPEDFDFDGFLRDMMAIRRKMVADLGEADLEHLRKVEGWGRAATAVGLATCWIAPNPLSMAALSLGRSTRWLMMHHVGHRGYDKVPGVAPRHTSKVFGAGLRRFVDWPDWMIPEAWKYEHNVLHHSNTGEEADPDLVERNTAYIHDLPRPIRWLLLGLLAGTWRATYYAPSTMEAYLGRQGEKPSKARVALELAKTGVPYALLTFGALPLAFLPLGPLASASAFVNSLGAEVLTNVHTFLVVGPNHSGDDLYRFDERPASKGEHFARQVLGSTNYATGDDVTDFLHLWLNYQIEHHLFPDTTMLAYQRIQPEVRALCDKYGLPYVQESVWKRFGKMARVFVGESKMKRAGAARPREQAGRAPAGPVDIDLPGASPA